MVTVKVSLSPFRSTTTVFTSPSSWVMKPKKSLRVFPSQGSPLASMSWSPTRMPASWAGVLSYTSVMMKVLLP